MSHRADGVAPGRGSGRPLGWSLLTATALLALVPRVWNLGTFSMWLDEIIQTVQAEMPWREMLVALRSDVHPPLDASVTWLLLRFGADEPARRLAAVAVGVVTVALLAELCSRRYGRAAGLATGLMAALSPMHVQYSQELRPYPLALALVVLAFYGLDRWLEDGGSRWLAASWASLVLAGCALYFATMALAPLLVRYFQASPPSRSPRERLRVAALFTSALLPGGLWLTYAWPFGNVARVAEPARWNLQAAGARLERLVVGGLEGQAATAAALLVSVLVVAGIWWSLRRHADASLLTGALLGTAGAELLLASVGHWSHSRFNLVAWPFLVALAGLTLSALWQARARALSRPLALVLALVMALAQLEGLRQYQQRGRPSWDWVARSAGQLAGSQGLVMAGGEWAHLCLSYYLRGAGYSSLADRLEIVRSPTEAMDLAGRECLYVVEGGHGQRRSRWRESPVILQDPGGLGAALFRLTAYESGLDCVWTLPFSSRSRPRAMRSLPEHESVSMPLDAYARPHLLAGWSAPERTAEGIPFIWATGRAAVLGLGGGEPRGRWLSLHVVASAPDQRVRLAHNGELVGEFELLELPATLTAPLTGPWREENVVLLELASSFVPSARDPASSDQRELSLALTAVTVDYR